MESTASRESWRRHGAGHQHFGEEPQESMASKLEETGRRKCHIDLGWFLRLVLDQQLAARSPSNIGLSRFRDGQDRAAKSLKSLVLSQTVEGQNISKYITKEKDRKRKND